MPFKSQKFTLDKLLFDSLCLCCHTHNPISLLTTCVESEWLAHKELLEKCTPSWKERKAGLTQRFTGWPLTRPPPCLLTFLQWTHLNEKNGGRRRKKRGVRKEEEKGRMPFSDGWGLLLLHLERTQLWGAVKYTQTSRLLQTSLPGTRPHIPLVQLWHMITARQYMWEQSALH